MDYLLTCDGIPNFQERYNSQGEAISRAERLNMQWIGAGMRQQTYRVYYNPMGKEVAVVVPKV